MQKNKKVYDITPPRIKERPRPNKERPRSQLKFSRSKVLVWSVAAIFGAVLLALLIIQIKFSSVSITLWPHMRLLNLQANIQVQAKQTSVSLAQQIIPGKIVTQEKSASKLYPATGSADKAAKAQGVIKVQNDQTKNQILVAGTRFISQDGKLFRSTQRVVISPQSSQNVSVIADQAGEDFNIGPSNFSLPGLAGSPLYTLVYGKSSQQMTGGAKSALPLVTQSDIDQAKNSLIADLTKLAVDELKKQVSAPYTLDASSLKQQVTQANSSVKAGAQLAQFSVRVQVQITGMEFQKADLETLAKNILKNQITSSEALDEPSLQLTYVVKNFDADAKTLLLYATFGVKVYQAVDLNELTSRVQGQKKSFAEAILSEYPQVAKSQIDLWPFWMSALPHAVQRIRISLSLDSQ